LIQGNVISSVGSKIVRLIACVLIAASVAFLVIFAPLYRQEILEERKTASLRIAATLQIALENAMLKRDLDGLREIVDKLGGTPNVDLAMIVAPKGEVRFSSDHSLLGRQDELKNLCANCAEAKPGDAFASFLTNERGAEVLRSVIAAPNREACAQCHGSAKDHPINGYLVVDFSAADVKARAWLVAGWLAAAGLLVTFLALGAVWWAIRRTVAVPLAAVSQEIERYGAEPNVAPRLPQALTRRNDEIGAFAAGWERLAQNLDATMKDMARRDAFLQSLLDALPDGVRVIAEDYSVLAANAEFCRQSGLTLDEVKAKPCYASSHGRAEPCIPTMVVCPLAELRSGARAIKASHMHVDAKGANFAAEVAAAPLANLTARDERRLIVESIRNLSLQTQVSQQQRLSELGSLAAGVAHEIHNPLASIRLGLHAIDRELVGACSSEDAKEFVRVVNIEVDRCLATTEKLIRLSRVPEPGGALVEVGVLAQDICALLKYEAAARGVKLHNEIGPDIRIISAAGDLGMVFVNLLQNALHAMPEGGALTLRARETPEKDVLIEVEDTGVGIDPQHLQKIFHPFWSWRADGSEGSGLGLAICEAVLSKWGGSISATSVVGEGSTFSLRFPNADKFIDQMNGLAMNGPSR
jgi:signal transduction histidine kinase